MFKQDDPRLSVTFHDKKVLNEAKTRRNGGKEVWETKTYTSIRIRGDKLTHYDQPFRPEDSKKYPHAWARYKDSTKAVEGTRLHELTGLSTDAALNYQTHGVMTVEELAELPDETLKAIHPQGRNHREAARNFLELQSLRAKAASMPDDDEDDAPMTAKRRGRPRKEEQAAA